MANKVIPPTNVDNTFDNSFKPVELNLVSHDLIEIEKEKIRLGEKFLSDDVTQKTEITNDQRLILSIIETIANHPFQISTQKCKKLKNYKSTFLIQFLKMFYKFGIPLDRKGRGEEVDVLKSLLSPSYYYDPNTKAHQEKLVK